MNWETCPCKDCITLPMCIGDTDPNLMPLVMKCSLLFGYLNCSGWIDKKGIFTIYSNFDRYIFVVIWKSFPSFHYQ